MTLPVSAGEVSPFPAVLRSKIVAEGRTLIEYCELGSCRNLSPDLGYTLKEWEKVKDICNEYSFFASAQTNLTVNILALSIAASKITAAGKAMLFTGLIIFDGKVSEEDASTATDMLGGVINPEGQYPLTLDKFISLRNGIEACVKEYEWRKGKYYRRYINGWARPLG